MADTNNIDQQIEDLINKQKEIESILENDTLSDDEYIQNNDLYQQLASKISELKIIRFMNTL